jgi:polyisoprenoid-binding protein YceI
MNQLNALAVALALPSAALAAPTNWSIDPSHSSTGFAVKHLVVSTVRGQFTKTGGTLRLDDADLARSSVEATIDAASIDTRAPDFFDTAKYPTITFKSTKVARAGKGQLRVTGDLTLHGVTKPVTLDVAASAEVKGMFGETRRGFSGTVKINRKDFGLTWGKVLEAGPVVGDEVTITLDIEAVKEPPKQAAE